MSHGVSQRRQPARPSASMRPARAVRRHPVARMRAARRRSQRGRAATAATAPISPATKASTMPNRRPEGTASAASSATVSRSNARS